MYNFVEDFQFLRLERNAIFRHYWLLTYLLKDATFSNSLALPTNQWYGDI